MDQFLGLTIISLSILGLAWSIGNIVMTFTKPLPVMHSLDNMIAFSKGYLDYKRQSLEKVE